MTEPSAWPVTPDEVTAWLSTSPGAAGLPPADTMSRVIAAVAEFAAACRPDLNGNNGFEPTAEVRQAAIMLTARVLRRRNTPSGVENFGDGLVSYVARSDPEIERMLRIGAWALPAIG